MEFKRKFGKRKQANSKRGIALVVLLAAVLILWFYAEKIMTSLLG